MTRPEEVISPDTLQRLVARAIELEEQGRESVSPARAGEIGLTFTHSLPRGGQGFPSGS